MKQPEIDYWIQTMLASAPDVSDLNITPGRPFQVETSGVLKPVTVKPPLARITPFLAEVFALNLIGGNKRLLIDLATTGSCDFSYWLGDGTRFRVNVFSRGRQLSTVLRKLPTEIPTIHGLGLPSAMGQMAAELNGLVLVTGATGSGKSTTLAAILDKINREKAVHVITLEDPVEFVHLHNKSTFNQRELGNDFDTFAHGLRAALRQAPKVILVGEMRDRETLEIGLTAAETGHLVLSTLHTVDAGATINRCLGMFEHDEQAQIRSRLADSLRWIACQRLLPKVGGGRVAAFEVMGMNLRLKEVIVQGESEDKTFYRIIDQSAGMSTFDDYIAGLFEQELVTEEVAMNYCSRPSVMGRNLDRIRASRGEETSPIDGLTMEDQDKGNRLDGFS